MSDTLSSEAATTFPYWEQLPNELREKVLQNLKPTLPSVTLPGALTASAKRRYIGSLNKFWAGWVASRETDLVHMLGDLPSGDYSTWHLPRHEDKPSSNPATPSTYLRTDTIVLPAGCRLRSIPDTHASLGHTLKITNQLCRRAKLNAGDFVKVGRIVVDGSILVVGDYYPTRWIPTRRDCSFRRRDVLEKALVLANRIEAVLHVEADEHFELCLSLKPEAPNSLLWCGKSLTNIPVWRSDEPLSSFKQQIYEIDMTASSRSGFTEVENVISSIVKFAETQSELMSKVTTVPSRPIILHMYVDLADEAAKKTFEEVESRMQSSRMIGSVLLQFGGESMLSELPYDIVDG